MTDPKIQAALWHPPYSSLSWMNSRAPGETLTEFGTGPGVDAVALALRDSELAWRDLAVAIAINRVVQSVNRVLSINQAEVKTPAWIWPWSELTEEGSTTTTAVSIDFGVPLKPGSVVVVYSVGEVQHTWYDHGRGGFVAKGLLLDSTINYLTGEVALTLSEAATATWAATGLTGAFIRVQSEDLNSGQAAQVGGLASIKLAVSSDSAEALLSTDKDLYRRDALLYKIAWRMSLGLSYAIPGQRSPELEDGAELPALELDPGDLGQAWSWANDYAGDAALDPEDRWYLTNFIQPDKALARRDTVLARLLAGLTQVAGSSLVTTTAELLAAGEDFTPFTGEDGTPVSAGTATAYYKTFYSGWWHGNTVTLRMVDTATSQFLARVDDIPFGVVHPDTGALVPISLAGSPAALQWNATSGFHRRIVLEREPETYHLRTETAAVRSFQALPFLPYDRQALHLDRNQRTLRWRPELPSIPHEPQPAGLKMPGLQESQVLEVVGAGPNAQNLAYFGQKAWQYPHSQWTSNVALAAKMTGLTHKIVAQDTSASSEPAVFLEAGNVLIQALPVETGLPAGCRKYQLSLAVQPAFSWVIKPSRYDSTLSDPGPEAVFYSSIEGYVTFPAAAEDNQYTSSANRPLLVWQLPLAAGAYKVKFDYSNNGTVGTGFNVTARLGSLVVFSGQLSGAAGAQTSPEFQISVPEAADEQLSITLNSNSAGSELEIQAVSFTKLGANYSTPVDFNVELGRYSDDGEFETLEIPTYKIRARGRSNKPLVVQAGFFDNDAFGLNKSIVAKITLVSALAGPLLLTGYSWSYLAKQEYLSETVLASSKVGGLQLALLDYLKDNHQIIARSEWRNDDGTWDVASTQAWITSLKMFDFGFSQAFRTAIPSDIGRPALVPTGLSWVNGEAVASADAAHSYSRIVPLEAWMLRIRIPVLHEGFWDIQPPPAETTLTVLT